MIPTRIRRATVVVAMLVTTMGLTAGPAHATAAVVTCPVGGTTSSTSPGLLLFQSRMVTATVAANYSCTVVGGGSLISFRVGSSSVSLPPAELTCLSPLATPPASQTINWNTGGSSTLTGTTTITDTGTAVVVTDRGVVTAGDFTGSPYVNVVEYTNLTPSQLLACLAEPGLLQRQGSATLIIG
jgi:hypothetical protein